MALADARAIMPSLVTRPADSDCDAAALIHLARWCGRYSPWVATDGEEGILIDASGCAHLFGGEAGMLDDMRTRLKHAGIEARVAIADTPGAAWAVARHGDRPIVPPGKIRDRIAPLPVSALRIEGEAEKALRRLGLKRIGELYDLPRAALARRFGHGGARTVTTVLHRLDQAFGVVFEPIQPMDTVPAWRVRCNFAEPVTDSAAFEALFMPMAEKLAIKLAKTGKGARRIGLSFFRVEGTRVRLTAGTHRPSRDPAHIARLFAGRFETVDPGFGIDLMMLSADVVAPLEDAQMDFTGHVARAIALSALVDRLALRLGPAHIGSVKPQSSHIPERAEQREAGLGKAAWMDTERPPGPRRPLRLLPRPEPVGVVAEVPEGPPQAFRWRRVYHRIRRAAGPERIAPEWWRDDGDKALVRDYYRVEDEAGRRYWLFRMGLYGEEIELGAPRWFVHGLFP